MRIWLEIDGRHVSEHCVLAAKISSIYVDQSDCSIFNPPKVGQSLPVFAS